MMKFYCISLPIVIICLFLAFLVMLKYFWMQGYANEFRKDHEGFLGVAVALVPSMIYAVEINIMNAVYRRLAHYLNDWGTSPLGLPQVYVQIHHCYFIYEYCSRESQTSV